MKKINQSQLRQIISLLTLGILVAFFALTSDGFLKWNNVTNILRNAGITGIIAVGVTLVIITAGIDLSTGSILAISAMTIANAYRYTTLPINVILLMGLIIGCLSGLFNGFIITKLNLPEFIATLATQGVFRGLTYMTAIKQNGTIRNMPIRDYRVTRWAGSINGIYYVTIAFVIAIIIGQILLRRTTFGNSVYATGANRKAAELSGVNTNRTRTIVYVITGLCCAVASIFMMSRMETATTEFGVGLEFDVIAAVVVGGCALNGGRGDMVGSMIGALFMATLDNGIYKYESLGTSHQLVIKGLIIVAVVVFDAIYRELMNKRTEKARAIADSIDRGAVI